MPLSKAKLWCAVAVSAGLALISLAGDHHNQATSSLTQSQRLLQNVLSGDWPAVASSPLASLPDPPRSPRSYSYGGSGGGGGGGYGGYGDSGHYGSVCNCPTAGFDSLSAFTFLGLGTLLGLLTSGLLTALVGLGTALFNTTGILNGRSHRDDPFALGREVNVTLHQLPVEGGRGYAGLRMADVLTRGIPGGAELTHGAIALLKPALDVYVGSQRHPKCTANLLCRFVYDATLARNGTVESRLVPLTGSFLSWLLRDNLHDFWSTLQNVDKLSARWLSGSRPSPRDLRYLCPTNSRLNCASVTKS